MAAEVPLTTLLSWTWIAYAIETDNAVEAAGADRVGRLFRISMPMWANGLRFIDSAGVTVDELRTRARAGCNIPGLERWGWITVGEAGAGYRAGFGTLRGVKGATVLRPTRAGVYARRLWPRAVAGVEQRACLEAVVAQREALAKGLSPPQGGWRAGQPYLARTQRVLADPAAALPWHPMVLHRGGWPDGS